MTDLAYTPEQMKEEKAEWTSDPEVPKYPYGLNLCFNDETLKTLGKTSGDFKVGDTFTASATFLVTGIRSRQTDKESEDSVDLTLSAIDMPGESEASRAQKIYPEQGS